jgi:hypothetical protein
MGGVFGSAAAAFLFQFYLSLSLRNVLSECVRLSALPPLNLGQIKLPQ